MKYRVLYLPVPHVSRDLASRLLLSREALLSGWSTMLVRKNWLLEKIDKLPPGVVFFGTSPSSIDDVKLIKAKGFYYAAECSEAGMWNKRRYLAYKAADSNLRLADLYVAWGQRHAEIVRERCDRLPILTSGSPRMDLSLAGREIFSDEVARLKELHGKYILIVSNGRGPHSRFNKANVDDTVVDLAGRFPDLSIAEYRKIAQEFVDNGEAFWAVTRQLAKECPEVKILYRPRFGDEVSRIREELAGTGNVRIVEEGPINPLIAASQGVVHQSCTSGLEAVLMEKPNIDFEPSKLSYPFEVAEKTFPKATSISEIKEFFGVVLGRDDRDRYRVPLSSVQPYIANIENKCSASKLIINRLDSDFSALPGSRNPNLNELLVSNGSSMRLIDRLRARNPVITILRKRAPEPTGKYKEPLDLQTIERYGRLLGGQHEFSITEVCAENAYILQAKPGWPETAGALEERYI